MVFCGSRTLMLSPCGILPVRSGVNFTVVIENPDRVLMLYARFFVNEANSIINRFLSIIIRDQKIYVIVIVILNL